METLRSNLEGQLWHQQNYPPTSWSGNQYHWAALSGRQRFSHYFNSRIVWQNQPEQLATPSAVAAESNCRGQTEFLRWKISFIFKSSNQYSSVCECVLPFSPRPLINRKWKMMNNEVFKLQEPWSRQSKEREKCSQRDPSDWPENSRRVVWQVFRIFVGK